MCPHDLQLRRTLTKPDTARIRRTLRFLVAMACATMLHAPAIAQGTGRTEALARALVDGAPRHVPRGYASATASRLALNDDDRRAGMVAGVLVTLAGGDPKGTLRFAMFGSEQQAEAWTRDAGHRLGDQVALKFLQYLPGAECADTRNGGICMLRAGDVVAVATASQVDRGTSLIMIAARETLDAAMAGVRSGAAPAPSPPNVAGSGARSGCALLTKADAASALGGPVGDARQGSDTCYYGSQARAGDSVTLQLLEGGRAKFDFDRGRIQRTASVPGIGDDAFVFASQAGFVQIYFIKGTGYASLTLANAHDANRLESAKALARRIAARL
ncbi:MAG: hypothetical protein ABI624_08140 [Casimicrobiaceae bacterium]